MLSATYGFALAAYQARYAWLWPLILIHGFADWTTILAVTPHPDWFIGLLHASFVGYGLWLLRPTGSEAPGVGGRP